MAKEFFHEPKARYGTGKAVRELSERSHGADFCGNCPLTRFAGRSMIRAGVFEGILPKRFFAGTFFRGFCPMRGLAEAFFLRRVLDIVRRK